MENDIVLEFQVPTLNTDGSGPADLRKIEVYGHTGPLAKPEDFIKYGDARRVDRHKRAAGASRTGTKKRRCDRAQGEGATGASGATGALARMRPMSPADANREAGCPVGPV